MPSFMEPTVSRNCARPCPLKERHICICTLPLPSRNFLVVRKGRGIFKPCLRGSVMPCQGPMWSWVWFCTVLG